MEPEQLVGLTLNGAYRLVRKIASGGMGVIFEGEHLRLPGKKYAVKVLHAAHSPVALQRFHREAAITSELGHDHIVEIHDFNVAENGMPYLVMELLEGEDLSQRIAHAAPMPLAHVVDIVKQVASGLDAAHREGVVHRDLKPQNIYLCRRSGRPDFVKILDFGVSKVRDSSHVITRENTVTGTPNYMSPEQAEGRAADVDHRTDIFALGVVIWEMLTGRRVFESPSVSGTLYKVRHLDPIPIHTIRADVPARVDDVICSAMAKHKRARYASVMTLADELAEVVTAHACAGAVPVMVSAVFPTDALTVDIAPETSTTNVSVWSRSDRAASPEPKKRILFVDDSPTMRALVSSWLEQAGYDVVLATDGEDGVAKAQAIVPDLVIADVNMPRRDGFALCRTIKDSALTTRIPVILFTRLDEATDIVNGLAAGADAFVVKGSGAPDLIRHVEYLVHDTVDPQKRKSAAIANMKARMRPTLGRKAIFKQLFAALFREVPFDILTLLVDRTGRDRLFLLGSHYELDHSVADAVARKMAGSHATLSGKPLEIEEAESEMIVIDETAAWGDAEVDLRRSVMVPMMDRGQVIGCLGVFSFEENSELESNIRFFFDIGVAAARALRGSLDET